MKPKERKKNQGDIEINIEDVEIIMGKDFDKLDILLDNVFCGHCTEHTTTIENYKIFLNDIDDLIFQGQCKRCHNQVARYIETGENKSEAEIARHIRTIKKEFKTL